MLWIDRDSTCSTLLMYWKNSSYDVGDQPLDLLGVHPAVVVDDVEDRLVERREDVFLHPVDAVQAAQPQGEHQHHHGDRAAECEDDWVHAGFARRTKGLLGQTSREPFHSSKMLAREHAAAGGPGEAIHQTDQSDPTDRSDSIDR